MSTSTTLQFLRNTDSSCPITLIICFHQKSYQRSLPDGGRSGLWGIRQPFVDSLGTSAGSGSADIGFRAATKPGPAEQATKIVPTLDPEMLETIVTFPEMLAIIKHDDPLVRSHAVQILSTVDATTSEGQEKHRRPLCCFEVQITSRGVRHSAGHA
jgi:hypothetical protein